MEGRKQEPEARSQARGRDGRWQLVGGLTLTLAVAVAGIPRPGLARAHRTPESRVAFTVRIYNHAQLAPDVLSSAERDRFYFSFSQIRNHVDRLSDRRRRPRGRSRLRGSLRPRKLCIEDYFPGDGGAILVAAAQDGICHH